MMEGRNQGENIRAEMADDDDAYAFPILSRPNQPPAGTFCFCSSRPPQMTERRLSPKESFLPAAEPSGLWIVISQLEGGPW